jgi:hypothetical protein
MTPQVAVMALWSWSGRTEIGGATGPAVLTQPASASAVIVEIKGFIRVLLL